MLKCSRNNTSQGRWVLLTLHRMSLTCTCLTISKYSPIITLQNTLNYWSSCILIYILLNSCMIKYLIKSKLFRGLLRGLRISYTYLTNLSFHLHYHLTTILFFCPREGSTTNYNFNTFGVFHFKNK